MNPEKRGPRGRPPGSKSWYRNPVNVAAHHASVLMELWLATSAERRFTVPPKIKRLLCERAIEHLDGIHRECVKAEIPSNWNRPGIDQVLSAVNRRAPAITLRRKAKLRK